jgi:hypothetical protein
MEDASLDRSSESSDSSSEGQQMPSSRIRGVLLIGSLLVALVGVAWTTLVVSKIHQAPDIIARAMYVDRAMHGDVDSKAMKLDSNNIDPNQLTLLHRAGRVEDHPVFTWAKNAAVESFKVAHAERVKTLNLLPAAERAMIDTSGNDDWGDAFMRDTMSKAMMQRLQEMNDKVVEEAAKADTSDAAPPGKPGDPKPTILSVTGAESLTFTELRVSKFTSNLDAQTAEAYLVMRGHFERPLVVRALVPMGDDPYRPGILSYPMKLVMSGITMEATPIVADIELGQPNMINKFHVNHVGVGVRSIQGTLYSKYGPTQGKPLYNEDKVSTMETGIMNKRLQKMRPEIVNIYRTKFKTQIQTQMDDRTPQPMVAE